MIVAIRLATATIFRVPFIRNNRSMCQELAHYSLIEWEDFRGVAFPDAVCGLTTQALRVPYPADYPPG